MHRFDYRMLIRCAAGALLCALFGPAMAVAEVSVKASLSRSSVELGESVQLQIEISGHQRDVSAPDIRFNEIAVVHVGQRIGSTTNFDGAGWQITSNTV